MKQRSLAISAILGLAACAPVLDETRSTIVVDGSTYELRTQVVEGRNGTFQRTSVIVKNTPFVCLADSPGDCEAAVRDARSHSHRD